jgi:hypothetical protein
MADKPKSRIGSMSFDGTRPEDASRRNALRLGAAARSASILERSTPRSMMR